MSPLPGSCPGRSSPWSLGVNLSEACYGSLQNLQLVKELCRTTSLLSPSLYDAFWNRLQTFFNFFQITSGLPSLYVGFRIWLHTFLNFFSYRRDSILLCRFSEKVTCLWIEVFSSTYGSHQTSILSKNSCSVQRSPIILCRLEKKVTERMFCL